MENKHNRSTKKITPSLSQKALNQSHFIQKFDKESKEQVPMDVVFVGGGPAGLSGAIELAQLVKKGREDGSHNMGDIEIGVLEKAENLGGHNLSGAIINPIAFQNLFHNEPIENFPFRQKVPSDKTYFLTSKGKFRVPTPPSMYNKGNYIASICEVVRWMGKKAEDLGVNIFNNFPVDSLLVEGSRVKGVRTTQIGLNRDGSKSPQYAPGTEVTAQITVLSEGTRGPLTQAYMNWQNITSNRPQIYALGVKELWKVNQPLPSVIHTLGWPLPNNAFGGSFMYPMAKDTVSLGLVVGLDYKQHNLDVHDLLQQMKLHPFFQKYLKGGEVLEWGARTIPEGGIEALPNQLCGDGLMMIGDCAGFVNIPALKGIHYSMQSGILAARSIYKALLQKDTSKENLKSYQESLKKSFIYKDLKKVKNIRHAFKNGLFIGAIQAALMTFTQGRFPSLSKSKSQKYYKEDAAEEKDIVYTNIENKAVEKIESNSIKKLSKVDAVYLSGNKTRDDIPQHLTVGEDISKEMADFYTHLCPAGVYEQQEGQLVVNPPNCIDCKATDVVGPRWQPREGGSGPNYKQM